MNEPPGQPEFNIPQNYLEQLYEFSGGADKYKGMIIALCSENGSPLVYSKYESPIIELGLRKATEDFLRDNVDEPDKN
jgi:hypothetical protein